MTVKQLRELIKTKQLNDFSLQDAVKFFAQNIDKMTLGEEVAFKEYIRKGADQLDIDLRDIQAVYNSFRSEA